MAEEDSQGRAKAMARYVLLGAAGVRLSPAEMAADFDTTLRLRLLRMLHAGVPVKPKELALVLRLQPGQFRKLRDTGQVRVGSLGSSTYRVPAREAARLAVELRILSPAEVPPIGDPWVRAARLGRAPLGLEKLASLLNVAAGSLRTEAAAGRLKVIRKGPRNVRVPFNQARAYAIRHGFVIEEAEAARGNRR